jgi:hypothetical protein
MLHLKHGGHVLPGNAPGAREAAKRMDYRVAESAGVETPFGYLLPALAKKADSHLPGDPAKVVKDLKALGEAMLDDGPPTAQAPAVTVNSPIPAVYTYWGQFLDHDITANTDRESRTSDITRPDLAPIPPDEVVRSLKNLRRPTLDLDSVYGSGPHLAGDGKYPGPDAKFYRGIRLRLGRNFDAPGIPGVKIPPEQDLVRDLPRIGPLLAQGAITVDDIPDSLRDDPGRDTRAFIGDLRNDENLIVAQLHLAFLRFHNNVVEAVEQRPKAFGLPPRPSAKARFDTARALVRRHYQWLVVHDYLKTVCAPGVVDKVLLASKPLYEPLPTGESFAPLEFSVAAYRFGHSMVRGGYDHNRNFGRPAPGQASVQPFASFDDLFRFTGNGFEIDPVDPSKSKRDPFRGAPTLPFNWIIEWDRMTRKGDPNEGHFARKIDTRLAPPIHNMVNEGTGSAIQDDADPRNKVLRLMLRSLSQRNLLRGYLLSIPTGQATARAMGIAPLSEAELRQGNTGAVNAALEGGGFLRNTPLWYYVLKEAEVRENGNTLGELGSRIVVETIIGLLRNDRQSYLNVAGGWDPSEGVKLPGGEPIVTIRDFLTFAGLIA